MSASVAAAIAVPIVFALLAKALPYRPPATQAEDVPLEVLAERYQRWEVGALAPFFLFAALFTFGWWRLFVWMHALALAQLPPSDLLLTLPAVAWLLPAIMLGIVTSALPLHFLYQFLLGERYAEYTHYTNLRVGFDGWQVFRWMVIGVGAGSLLALIWGLDCYTRLEADRLVHNSVWSLGQVEERPYAEVAAIRRIAKFTAPNGNIVQRPYYQMVFQDGYVLSTRELLGEDKDVPTFVELVSKRSGKEITAHEFAPE